MSVDFSVNGKHVLITGGTGGIGSAFAEAFLGGGAVVTCAGRAVFLASPAASIVTGVTIAADAGYSVT